MYLYLHVYLQVAAGSMPEGAPAKTVVLTCLLYVPTSVNKCTCTYTRVPVPVPIHVCLYLYLYTCACTCTYTRVPVPVPIHVCLQAVDPCLRVLPASWPPTCSLYAPSSVNKCTGTVPIHVHLQVADPSLRVPQRRPWAQKQCSILSK